MARQRLSFTTFRREPIPVEMVDPNKPDTTIDFNIRSSAALSMRERKLLMNYLQAIADFEQLPDDELNDHDYYRAHEMRADAIELGTEGLDMTFFRGLSEPDQIRLCLALYNAFSEENDGFMNMAEQVQRARQPDAGEERPGNAFRRMSGTTKSSSELQPISRVPTVVDSQTG